VTSNDCIIRDAVFAAATVVVEDVIGTTTTAFFATANDDDDNEDEEIIAPPPPAAVRGGGEDVFVDGDRLRYGLAITIVQFCWKRMKEVFGGRAYFSSHTIRAKLPSARWIPYYIYVENNLRRHTHVLYLCRK